MEILFLCVIVFLFVLAVFDLSVGVSNDAVNFLNSAVGSRAGSYKRIIIVASIGIFAGAIMSNGMMDIARHGIFRPEHFSFYELLCICMAVMVTDIILLDIFNSLGLPTSTTVSLVFELLGATFVVALLKMASGGEVLSLHELINTEKALEVILGIFLSVAIAFFFGTVVQFLSRMIFSFDYRSSLRWKIGIYGGVCSTAIIYFLIINGAKDLTFMTPAVKSRIEGHTPELIAICFVATTLLMQTLHVLRVNVLKVVVLLGTFALAMAFAGNDLVNFIGVPLTGLSSWQDFTAHGGGDSHGYMMSVLNGPANTPVYFLVGAGVIMVVSLSTSKKAQNVTKTELGLGSQGGEGEMFGSSRLARSLVRFSLNALTFIRMVTPASLRRWLDTRFDVEQTTMEQGAMFDLIRASVNLVLAGVLIAVGTSMRLPLSTTFVTFMVAMGTSLADRAWGRESAVFRITGVMSVIGGWFITAGAAFIGAGLIVLLMHLGGVWVMMLFAVATIVLLIDSNRRFKRRKASEDGDTARINAILASTDSAATWALLLADITLRQRHFWMFAHKSYMNITAAFLSDDPRALAHADKSLHRRKHTLKADRRKETLCMSHISRQTAAEKGPWFHLTNNCCMTVLYNLRRITESCREHVDNNFRPLSADHAAEFENIRSAINRLFADIELLINSDSIDSVGQLRRACDETKDLISTTYHRLLTELREGNPLTTNVNYVYLNALLESQEMVSALRKYLRGYAKLRDTAFVTR